MAGVLWQTLATAFISSFLLPSLRKWILYPELPPGTLISQAEFTYSGLTHPQNRPLITGESQAE